jgi:serine/threonine protein kinase
MQEKQDLDVEEKFPDLRCEKPDASSSNELACLQHPDLSHVPANISQYRFVKLIESGSCGVVWQAVDEHGAAVAIKLFRKDLLSNADAVQRFHQEAKMLRRISHPNVVSILDFGKTTDGFPYIVMDLIEGRTIKSLLKTDGVFEPKHAAGIAREICRALIAAHAQTIIHRDLKPGNVIITSRSDARLVDFGIAKAVGYSGETITELGGVVGTPAYMSPEQCLGESVDSRSDIYSLGCTLFEMLTGSKAFESSGMVEAIAKQLSPDRSDIASRLKATGAPPALQSIILKCLQRLPSDRYATASQVEHDLSAFILGVPLRYCGMQKGKTVFWAALICTVAMALLALSHFLNQRAVQPPAQSPVTFLPSPPISIGTGVEIRNRFSNKLIFSDHSASDMKQALTHAAEQKISLGQADLRNAQLDHAKLNGLDLHAADFSGASFVQAEFTNVDLRDSIFFMANLCQANFRSTDCSNAQFVQADLGQCHLSSNNFNKASFVSAHVGGADLDNSNFRDAGFVKADLMGTSMKNAHCEYANFVLAILDGAGMQGAHCEHANFNTANLSNTQMQYAHCENADFSYATLNGTWFEYAHLRNACFRGCSPLQVRASHAELDNTGMSINLYGELQH